MESVPRQTTELDNMKLWLVKHARDHMIKYEDFVRAPTVTLIHEIRGMAQEGQNTWMLTVELAGRLLEPMVTPVLLVLDCLKRRSVSGERVVKRWSKAVTRFSELTITNDDSIHNMTEEDFKKIPHALLEEAAEEMYADFQTESYMSPIPTTRNAEPPGAPLRYPSNPLDYPDEDSLHYGEK